MRPMPSPVATATTPVVGGGPGGTSAGPLPAALAPADPTFLFHLFEQVGHPDVAGAPGVQRRFHRSPDVVGVDVAVPQPVPTDDHDGITQAGPDLLEGGHRLVGCLEQVHHLVAQIGNARTGLAVPAFGRRRSDEHRFVGELRGIGQPPPVHHRGQCVEQQHEARPAGVDHPGLGQHGEELGRSGQGVGGAAMGRIHHVDQRRTGSDRRSGRFGRSVGDGQDGPLDRAHHRLAGQAVGQGQRLGQARRVQPGMAGGAGLGDPPEELRQDDPRVTTGPHQRAVGDGGTDSGHVRLLEAVDLGHHRLEGEGHVGARVPVRHRIDVQPVDHSLVGTEQVTKDPDSPAEVSSIERVEDDHVVDANLYDVPRRSGEEVASWQRCARYVARSHRSA